MTTAEAKKRVDVDFYWQDIVIGSDLDAVNFASKNYFCLLRNREPYYHSYDNYEDEWACKIYDLSIAGLTPFSGKIVKIRVNNTEKIIKVHTHQSVYSVGFSRLHVLDDDNVEGVDLNRELVSYKVVDWFDCKGVLVDQQQILLALVKYDDQLLWLFC